MMETTSKGPYLLGDNLGVVPLGNRKLVPSSHTFDPMMKGLNRGFSLIQEACALRCASWAASLASLIDFRRCSKVGMSVLLVGWWMRGVNPISKSNGVLFVVDDGYEFFVRDEDGGFRTVGVCDGENGVIFS